MCFFNLLKKIKKTLKGCGDDHQDDKDENDRNGQIIRRPVGCRRTTAVVKPLRRFGPPF